MPSIAAQLEAAFRTAITAAFGVDVDPLISPAQNEKFGDYQSNAAMGLAKVVAEKTGQKTNPRAVAEQVKAKLDLGSMASEISIAGPGFINVKLDPAFLGKSIERMGSDPRLGIEKTSEPRRAIIDYPSPNVAKEMHIGHMRPMDIGDSLARLIEFLGHTVVRQNHLGDWGTAFGMLLTYLGETGGKSGESIRDLDSFYKASKTRFDEDPAFADASRAMVVKLQGGDAGALAQWRDLMDRTRDHFEQMYKRMNTQITREAERGESFYNPTLGDVVRELETLNVAVPSEGASVVWVEGFEAPLMVRKTGGGFGYAATDLAALRYRIRELHGQWLVYVTDSRQTQHFKQFLSAARRAGWITPGLQIDHVTFGTILGEDGKPIKTKSGESVRLRDVLEEAEQRAFKLVDEKSDGLSLEAKQAVARAVGIGALKYFDLNKDRLSDYQFDWEKMLSMDGNTAPYLQYAHARIRSIFRKAAEQNAVAGAVRLESPYELTLAKHVLRLPEIISVVTKELKPHVLCTYLFELATKFSAFYENCPVLKSEDAVRASRLTLCDVTRQTLSLGLDLLGIEHPEEM